MTSKQLQKKIEKAKDVPIGRVFQIMEEGKPTSRFYKRVETCPIIGNVTALRFPDKLKCQVEPDVEVRVGFATVE